MFVVLLLMAAEQTIWTSVIFYSPIQRLTLCSTVMKCKCQFWFLSVLGHKCGTMSVLDILVIDSQWNWDFAHAVCYQQSSGELAQYCTWQACKEKCLCTPSWHWDVCFLHQWEHPVRKSSPEYCPCDLLYLLKCKCREKQMLPAVPESHIST